MVVVLVRGGEGNCDSDSSVEEKQIKTQYGKYKYNRNTGDAACQMMFHKKCTHTLTYMYVPIQA